MHLFNVDRIDQVNAGHVFQNAEGNTLDVSALPAGIYLARIVTENETLVNKFVKK